MSKYKTVFVAYSEKGHSFLESFALPENSTAADALDKAKQNPAFPVQFSEQISFAVFGRTIMPNARLNDGDRVEILRPLQRDPKEIRMQRALPRKAR